MPFPFSSTTEVHVAGSREEALRRVQRELSLCGAKDFEFLEQDLRFGVGWTVSSGPLFLADEGRCRLVGELAADRPLYRCLITLSFRRSFLKIVVGVVLWIGGGTVVMSGWDVLPTLAVFLPIGILWLFTPWYLITPAWLRRRLRTLQT